MKDPRGENEPSDPHQYISMTESVNKQLNHIEKQCPPHACNTVYHQHTLLCCAVQYLHCCAEPAAHCKDKFVCVCVFEQTHWLVHSRGCYHRDSSDKYLSLPEPTPHEREASLTLQKKKTPLPRYSTSLQSGLQYLCNTHLGMLKNLKLGPLQRIFM